MSSILEQLILDRRRGVIAYGQLLDSYMELAKNVEKPEENTMYPESIRSNGARGCKISSQMGKDYRPLLQRIAKQIHDHKMRYLQHKYPKDLAEPTAGEEANRVSRIRDLA